ncbi:MAG: hypothetical protein J6A13_06360 [Paludibacteraceae bacterium]|nr:hypothetical protein [Paludibacteraceae bacterium]
METLPQFRTLEDLVTCLNKERKLLSDVFSKRKTHVYSMDLAMELVEHRRERIQYLIDNGVIHESGNFLELEDIYMQFFEEVLDVNEEINIASVKECIDFLKENINYYLQENHDERKNRYFLAIRKKLRDVGLRTIRNIIDLKRNVDTAYKQEPNFEIKKQRLKNLDEKKENIQTLIKECERLMDNDQAFFSLVSDPHMARTMSDVRNDFNDAYHNLYAIEKQIIEYLHLIEQQDKLFKKIRRLEYLRRQYTIKDYTNIQQVVAEMSPVWMENRPYNKLHLSIESLQSSDDMAEIIRKVGLQQGIIRKARTSAPPLSIDELAERTTLLTEINPQEIWRAFRAGSNDLFSFILSYDYKLERTIEQHALLFCQLVIQHPEDCRFTNQYATYKTLEYPLIYAK